MGIWEILNRIRDPLGELPDQEEQRQRTHFEAIRQRVRALEAARRTVGGVEQELERARRELSDAGRGLPRGHTRGFITLCLWFAGTLTCLVFASARLLPIATLIWGSPEHWYLLRFRPFAAGVWRVWRATTSSAWSVAIPVIVLALVWAAQRKLPRWRARCMIRTVVALETVFVLVITGSLFNLLTRPLV